MKHCFRCSRIALFLILSLVLVAAIGGDITFGMRPPEGIQAVLLTLTNDGHGETDPMGTKYVLSRMKYRIAAKPFPGYQFAYWSKTGGDGSVYFDDVNSANTSIIVGGANVTLMAHFIEIPFSSNEILDVKQANDGYDTCQRIEGKIGQSFIANYTGKLSKVELFLAICVPIFDYFNEAEIKVNIRSGSDLTGPIIGSSQPVIMKTQRDVNMGSMIKYWCEFKLDNVMVTRGQKYVIEVIDTKNSASWEITDSNPYSDGIAFIWNQDKQIAEEQSSKDFLFKTYVMPKIFYINFQPANTEIPDGYLSDYGDIYGSRNDYTYGWNTDHRGLACDREMNPDQRFDTLIQFANDGCWDMEIANGTYEVTVGIGDAEYDGDYSITVEGVNYWEQTPLKAGDFAELSRFITVWDSRLTINQGDLNCSTRINYVKIKMVPPSSEVLDQSQTMGYPRTTQLSSGSGQSFTAQITGKLSRVELEFSHEAKPADGEAGEFRVNIRKGKDLSGLIIGRSQPVKLVDKSANYKWYEFTIDGAWVNKGEQYVIEVEPIGAINYPVAWDYNGGVGYSYDGVAYWQHQAKPIWEYTFKTYVMPDAKDFLMVIDDGNGRTNPPGEVMNNNGVIRKISATPDDGYQFMNWTKTDGNGTVEFGNANAAETTVTLTGGSAGIQANFSLLPGYNALTITDDGNGTTDPANSVAVYYSDSREITAIPKKGYYFVNWTKTDDGTGTVVFEDANSATTRVTVSGGNATIKANFAEISLTKGLAGYWKFNENSGTTITDSSMNNHNGSLIGSPQWVVGHNSSGILLNNQTKDYINLGSADFGLTNELTLSAWVKTKGDTGVEQVLFRRGQYVNPFSLALERNNMPINGCIRTNSSFYANSSTRIKANEWHQIVMTYQSGALVIYLDGKEVARNNNPIGNLNFGYGVSETYIGAGPGSEANGFFNGVIDEFRIYNRALNPAEVDYLYKNDVAQ